MDGWIDGIGWIWMTGVKSRRGWVWIWEDPEVEGETGWSGGAVMEWMGHLLDFRVWS